MYRRQPAAGTPVYVPKGWTDRAASRRSTPLLPRLFTSDSRTRGSAGAWWQNSDRLPYLSPGVPYGPRSRGTLRTLVLPPLPYSTARGAGARGTRQPAVSVGTLLGQFLPTKFRDFLHHLRTKYTEPQAHPPSAPQYPKGASEHYPGLRNPSCSFYPGLRNPSCSFLPDLWDQPSHSEDSFKKKPTAGLPRGEFITARKANALSREGLRTRRRNCPFRVRFEDETLQDTALRYWERSRAFRQNIFPCEQTALPSMSVSERVLGSVGRWLESLPRALRPRAQDTVAGSSFWNCPRVAAQEPQIYFSEDANMSSRLPFIHRATAIRPRGGLRTFLDTPNSVEQEPFLPSMMMQSVLNRGRPKGYRLLLPYTNQQQAQREYFPGW
ncbi:uncharacterized protein C9orf50 homolog isoform X2 [Cricetulus griseus]|uniref:Uncharacterized protein C9orf50 homolog isoform X2 n=2 Tax=Cricetulus griseus TaxID=10029 RepID=A0A9J7G8B9_CRIGR|nr:uncharacterized protein C9orf50 homolog isoform X2 [Cricetulus griseus]XP_027279001.1 uncharacterized protein C9orf50 homolog isoform X2 [Cricetulus griseus]